MKKQERKEEKGITLVALVVTIIVLLILAGITINIVLNNDGIINKTKQGAEEYENAQKEEQELLEGIEGYIEYAGKNAPIPEGYTKSQITTEDDVAEGLVIYEIPEGATVNWTDEEDENGNNQSTITIGGTTTNLQETVNQYVWIPVEDINSMVMCKSNTGESVCNLVYDKVADTLTCQIHPDTATDLVGRLYIGTLINEKNNIYSYKMDFSEKNQIYDENNCHEPATINSDQRNGLTIEQLNKDFIAMATSVANNKGFYISRYEVGKNGDSKKGQTVLTTANSDNIEENYLGANTWYGLYNTIRNIDTHKQMIWGCQFDQVIKFMEKEAQIGHDNRKLTNVPSVSAQNNMDRIKNVYDLEGNFSELTMEASTELYRISHTGSFYDVNYGEFYSVSYSNIWRIPSETGISLSSRSTLYL